MAFRSSMALPKHIQLVPKPEQINDIAEGRGKLEGKPFTKQVRPSRDGTETFTDGR